jgi:Domain of unknown function (DUF4114)
MSNIEIGSLTDNYFYIGSTGKNDPTNTYYFSLPTMGSTHIAAKGFIGDISMEVLDKEEKVIKSIVTSGTNTGILTIDNLGPADYTLKVSPVADDTNYQISLTPDGKVDPLTGMGVEAGYFTTDKKGQIGFDLLHDGGLYQGEIAIFSLDGMEKFIPGSKEFIKEAASRAKSNSELGHIVISDATEGANPEFSGGLGEKDFNDGQYQGVKTFAMIPGKAFAVMLVPNGTVEEVFNNPDITGQKRPLFSLSSSNPNDAWLYGQIADITRDGKAFAIEDQRADSNSDKDYNDVIFNVTGATGKAVWVKEVINPAKDWTDSDIGKKLIGYVKSTLPIPEPKPLPIEEPKPLPIEEPKPLPIEEPTPLPVEEPTPLPVEEPTPLPVEEPTPLPIEEPTPLPVEEPTPLPVEEPTPLPVEEPTPLPIPEPTPTPNESPKYLQLNLPTTVKPNEAIQITDGKIFDANGTSDLDKVEFWLQKEGGDWEKVGDVTNFTADSLDKNLAKFDYELKGLEAGKYQFKAIAYDKSGAASNEILRNFLVNTPPSDLQFRIYPLYTNGEKLSFKYGKVIDAEGVSDIDRVDFWLQKEGGEKIEITNDVREFESDDEGIGRFDFSYDLSQLQPGRYQGLPMTKMVPVAK